MQAFTAMSPEGIRAVVNARRDTHEHYDMSLNDADFSALIQALAFVYDSGAPVLTSIGGERLDDWCASFVGSIAETLGVEFI